MSEREFQTHEAHRPHHKCFTFSKISPHFHSVEEIALSLASYYLRHSFRNSKLPKSTLHYYWRVLSRATLPLKLSGEYAIDETGVRLVHGVLYWFWAVRDLNTG